MPRTLFVGRSSRDETLTGRRIACMHAQFSRKNQGRLQDLGTAHPAVPQKLFLNVLFHLLNKVR